MHFINTGRSNYKLHLKKQNKKATVGGVESVQGPVTFGISVLFVFSDGRSSVMGHLHQVYCKLSVEQVCMSVS